MSNTSIIVQQPSGPVQKLILLTHGVGSTPQSMLELAAWFANRDTSAFVVSIASAQPSDISAAPGRQWFSIRGVTEDNRQARVDAALPDFMHAVRHWQQVTGIDAGHTLIAGFSQGAIMALESTKLDEPPALEIAAFAGRYATLPTQRPKASIHLLHGEADAVMPVELARAAHARLTELGADVSLDTAAGIGHVPHPALLPHLALH